MLHPQFRNRPFTLRQHYTVPRGPYRFVKDAPPELPRVVRRCPQPARSRDGAVVEYAMVNNLTSLLWMVELGALDLHIWPSRCDKPDAPDDTLQLGSFVRTSGGEGLHVLVPIARRHSHQEARRFAKMIGQGRQVVAGYSVRPLPYAPVATPLERDELNPRLQPREHNLQTVPQRVADLGDLHAPLLRGRQLLAIGTRLRNNSYAIQNLRFPSNHAT